MTDMPDHDAWNPFCIAADSTLELGTIRPAPSSAC